MADLQYVIFRISDEEFGVSINQVQEISAYQKPTPVPNSPDFIKGIINLRGVVIPIVDLRTRFGITQEEEITENTRLVIMSLESKQFGCVVDDASEVLNIEENEIEEVPEIIRGSNKKYLSGIGKVDLRILVLVNMELLLSEEEVHNLDELN